MWAAADHPLSHQHSSRTCRPTAAAAAGSNRQQQARDGSCQETFMKLSQHERSAAAHSSRAAAPGMQHPAAGFRQSTLVAEAATIPAAAPDSSHPHLANKEAGCNQPAPAAADTPEPPTAQPGAFQGVADSCSGGSSTSPSTESCSPISSDGGSSDGSSSSSVAVNSRSRITDQLGKLSYRMVLSYDGTAYSGWQLQTRARTIQAEIERALSTVLREDRSTLSVCAAGRTDAGVHAVGQVGGEAQGAHLVASNVF